MLKIVYPICCGMDVHKSFVYACIASTNEQGVTTYKSKRFSTFNQTYQIIGYLFGSQSHKQGDGDNNERRGDYRTNQA